VLQGDRSEHEKAIRLIRGQLDSLKASGSRQWSGLPRFVFLLLEETSEMQSIRSVVIKMLTRRLDFASKRIAHGAND
jgi:hypothetical protein